MNAQAWFEQGERLYTIADEYRQSHKKKHQETVRRAEAVGDFCIGRGEALTLIELGEPLTIAKINQEERV